MRASGCEADALRTLGVGERLVIGDLRPSANTFEIVRSPEEAQADKLNSDR